VEDYAGKGATLQNYLRVIFRYKAIILFLSLTIVIAAYINLQLKTPFYVASVKILVSGKKMSEVKYYQNVNVYRTLIPNHSEIVKSKSVVERVVRALKLYERPPRYEKKFVPRLKAALIDFKRKMFSRKKKDEKKELTPEEKMAFVFKGAVQKLTGSIGISLIEGTDIFTIDIRDFDPVQAAIIANAVSRSYVIFDLEQQIAELKLEYGEKYSTVIKLENYIKKMEATLDGRLIPDIEAIGPASIKIIEQAQIPLAPVMAINKKTALLAAFVMSIFLGIMIAFGFDHLNQTFKSPQDIDTYLDVPLLGSVPKSKPKNKILINNDYSKYPRYLKAYQDLCEHTYLLMKDKNIKVILIADAEGSEETTDVIANLGFYFARMGGQRALIIDANLRNPSVFKIFNISNSKGLINVLEEKIPFEDAVQDLGSRLYVLPAGKTVLNPIILLDSPIMSNLIKRAKEQFEMILIKCADVKNFKDFFILSSIVDGIALVVNEGGSRRFVVKSAIDQMKQKNINIIGVILNNRTYVIPKIIYKLT